eukprot:TCONS_00027272-protein
MLYERETIADIVDTLYQQQRDYRQGIEEMKNKFIQEQDGWKKQRQLDEQTIDHLQTQVEVQKAEIYSLTESSETTTPERLDLIREVEKLKKDHNQILQQRDKEIQALREQIEEESPEVDNVALKTLQGRERTYMQQFNNYYAWSQFLEQSISTSGSPTLEGITQKEKPRFATAYLETLRGRSDGSATTRIARQFAEDKKKFFATPTRSKKTTPRTQMPNFQDGGDEQEIHFSYDLTHLDDDDDVEILHSETNRNIQQSIPQRPGHSKDTMATKETIAALPETIPRDDKINGIRVVHLTPMELKDMQHGNRMRITQDMWTKFSGSRNPEQGVTRSAKGFVESFDQLANAMGYDRKQKALTMMTLLSGIALERVKLWINSDPAEAANKYTNYHGIVKELAKMQSIKTDSGETLNKLWQLKQGDSSLENFARKFMQMKSEVDLSPDMQFLIFKNALNPQFRMKLSEIATDDFMMAYDSLMKYDSILRQNGKLEKFNTDNHPVGTSGGRNTANNNRRTPQPQNSNSNPSRTTNMDRQKNATNRTKTIEQIAKMGGKPTELSKCKGKRDAINKGFNKYCAICHMGNHGISECNYKKYFSWDDVNHVMKFKGEEQAALLYHQSPHIQNHTDYANIADQICQTMERRGYTTRPGGTPNRKTFTPTEAQKKDMENKACFLCHKTGHQRRDCPQKPKKDTIGCLKTPKDQEHTLPKVDVNTEEVDFLYNISDTTPTIQLQGENGQKFDAMFDTGASRTTIPKAEADRLGIDYHTKDYCVDLVTASGSRIKTLGKGMLKFYLNSLDGKQTQLVEGEVYVLKESIDKALIGREFYMKYNLCVGGMDGKWFVSTVDSLCDNVNQRKREADWKIGHNTEWVCEVSLEVDCPEPKTIAQKNHPRKDEFFSKEWIQKWEHIFEKFTDGADIPPVELKLIDPNVLPPNQKPY